MMSLAGIMMYKLFTSYKAWKNSTAFFTPSDSFNAPNNNLDFSKEAVNSDFIEEHKAAASDSQSIVHSETTKISGSKASVIDNKPATILNDYIGEFFSEPQVLNIEPYRATEPKNVKSINNLSVSKIKSSSTSEIIILKVDDEIIKVEPKALESSDLENTTDLKSFPIISDDIPTLNEFSDLESESFITVSSVDDDIKSNNKVMSDKVVIAMLDEARLVCAS